MREIQSALFRVSIGLQWLGGCLSLFVEVVCFHPIAMSSATLNWFWGRSLRRSFFGSVVRTDHENGHWRSRCSIVSEFDPQRAQISLPFQPRLMRFALVKLVSWKQRLAKYLTLSGTLICQIYNAPIHEKTVALFRREYLTWEPLPFYCIQSVQNLQGFHSLP